MQVAQQGGYVREKGVKWHKWELSGTRRGSCADKWVKWEQDDKWKVARGGTDGRRG